MIDYHHLLNWKFPEVEQKLTQRDTILYALGIGLGADPLDTKQLRFVYEKNLLAFPSMAAALCYPGNWLRNPQTGVDFLHVLNGGTQFVIPRPLMTEGTLICRPQVIEIVDKGKGKGAIVVVERKVYDKTKGALLCTVTTTQVCRGDGGFGGPGKSSIAPAPWLVPNASPQKTVEISTARNLALIYRVHGEHNPISDQNPIHVDPDVACAAGFPAPILHGLSTLGIATHALLKGWCDYDPAQLKSMSVRYSAPVIPGDVIRTDMWREDSIVRFRCVVAARRATVLDHGRAELGT